MVDRVDKIRFPEIRRVNPNDSATDERKRRQQPNSEEEDEAGDGFDLLSERTDWHVLFDHPHLWQQNVEILAEEVKRIQYLGINLKTDPSLLKIRVDLHDGSVIPNAYLSVARSYALQLKNLQRLAPIELKRLTSSKVLWLTIPKDEKSLREEITRVTTNATNKTFSRTVKKYLTRSTWLQKLGIQDPVSRRVKTEIVWIYVTVVVVFCFFLFGMFYLME
jgi:hypothetical protein